MSEDFYRRLIKPIRDKKINEILSTLSVEQSYPYDKELNFAERIIPIKNFVYIAKKWLKDELLGLDNFSFVYVMNGNTDSINHIMLTNNGKFGWYYKDYIYYKHLCSKAPYNRTFVEMIEPEEVDHLFVTWPGYSNGDDTQVKFSNSVYASQGKHLDVAYATLTKNVGFFDVSAFDTVSISFSKTLSIPFNRIALLFSKKEISTLENLNKLGYVNIAGVFAATKLMQEISPNHWREKYSLIYDEICLQNNIIPTECFLFGYDQNGIRIGLAPYFQKLISS